MGLLYVCGVCAYYANRPIQIPDPDQVEIDLAIKQSNPQKTNDFAFCVL
jgi:hypothetical protein